MVPEVRGGGRLKVLVIPYAMMPTPLIGIIRPLSALHAEVELTVRLPSEWTVEDIAAADLVCFSRNIDEESLDAFRIAQAMGRFTIYEVDDSFFDAPAGVNSFNLYRAPKSLAIHLEFLQKATRVHSYSERVTQQVQCLGGSPHRTPAYFDDDLRINEVDIQARPSCGTQLEIVYPTGRTDSPETDLFTRKLLLEILGSFPQARIHVWKEFSGVGSHERLVRHPGKAYKPFLRMLRSLNPDVGLAILGDTLFESSKTNIKYRDYGGLGIPGVYSDVGPYRESVEQQETGLLVPNDVEMWVEAVGRLAASRDLRMSIAHKAYLDIRDNYNLSGVCAWWRSVIREVRAAPTMPMELSALRPTIVLAPRTQSVSRYRAVRRYLAEVPSASVVAADSTVSGAQVVCRELDSFADDRRSHSLIVGFNTTDGDMEAIVVKGSAPTGEEQMVSFEQWLPEVRRTPLGERTLYWDAGAVDGPRSRGFVLLRAIQLVSEERGSVIDWRAPTHSGKSNVLGRIAQFQNRLVAMQVALKRGTHVVLSYPGGPLAYMKLRRTVQSQHSYHEVASPRKSI